MENNQLDVIIHGGAGRSSAKYDARKMSGLKAALDKAWSLLSSGAPGEEAVVAALREMEGDEYFNAGFGGYPNKNGVVLLDVGLMKGNRDFIGLMNMRRVKFPSVVALDMLRERSHLLSVWTHELMLKVEDSPTLQEKYGFVHSHEEMISDYIRQLIDEKEGPEVEAQTKGTVGCVVRDAAGELCAGTSTGGTYLKPNGRIGDTPIIGTGVYADSEVCALSTTGYGESFMLSMVSGFIIAAVRDALRSDSQVFEQDGTQLEKLLRTEFMELERKSPPRYGNGAIIIIPHKGRPAFHFNSDMVSVAMRTGTAARVEREYISIEKRL